MRRRLAFLVALASSCAGEGSPIGPVDTDTDTDVSTSFGPSTTDDSTPDDSSDSSDSVETTFESQSGEGSSSSGSSSESTGCLVGTVGCPCDLGNTPCEKGLECSDEDICVEPLCPPKKDENNDAFNDAHDLGEFDDGDPDQTYASALSGTEDIDWFTYSCTDTTFEDLVPTLAVESVMPARTCLFIDCMIGGNPLFDCPAGTTPEVAPIDFIPGCCVEDGSLIDVSDYNCPDSDNDGVIAHIKVEMAASEMCIDYTMTYTC